MTVQTVFQRYEQKYWLNAAQYAHLRDLLAPMMREDAYGRYSICSLYYDTDQFDLIRASLDKAVYREKLRLRSYGVPNAETRVFLEIKKKFQRRTGKRRIALTLRQAQEYLHDGVHPPEEGQILHEMDFLTERYRLSPKVLIAYDRVALYSEKDEGLRVTFDTNIRCRTRDLSLEAGDDGEPLSADDRYLMEVKTPSTVPLWLARILSDCGLLPVSFSKYGEAYRTRIRWTAAGCRTQTVPAPAAATALNKERIIHV